MKPTIKSHRGLKALTTGIGAFLLALASADLASAQVTNTGTGPNVNVVTTNGTSAAAAITTGTNNTAYGLNALRFTNAGSRNTAIGVSALSANTTGNFNVAIGGLANLSNALGSFNVALGDEALVACTTGSSNIALGDSAGFSLTSGSNNIYIGNPGGVPGGGAAIESGKIRIGTNLVHTDTFLAGIIRGNGSGLTGITATSLAANSVTSTQLASGAVTSAKLASGLTFAGTTNVTGTLNLPVSTSTAGFITQGSNRLLHTKGNANIFLGDLAGNFTMTGGFNSAVGHWALQSNTTGASNTATGEQALAKNTTGTSNTAIGASSLILNTAGNANTAVGTRTLQVNTIGFNNTVLGFSAGQLITGTNNIAIGSNGGANLTTGSNNIAIGHIGFGGESSTIRLGTEGQQTKTVLVGKVGIGTSSPNAAFELLNSSTADILATAHSSVAQFIGQAANGTPLAPTALLAGQQIAFFSSRGYTGTGFSASRAAMIHSASENWSPTAHGTEIAFETTPNLTTTRTEKMRITNNGNVGILTKTPKAALDINSATRVGDGAGPAMIVGPADSYHVEFDGEQIQAGSAFPANLFPSDLLLNFSGGRVLVGDHLEVNGPAVGPALTLNSDTSGTKVGVIDLVTKDGNEHLSITPTSIRAWTKLPTAPPGGGRTLYINPVAGNVEIGSFLSTTTVLGTFVNSSDRNLKEDFAPVDRKAVLARLVDLPVSTWKYKSGLERRHVGPMAQDFHAAFNELLDLKSDDKTIAPLDEAGIAFTAIQGLNEVVKEKDRKIQQLEERLTKIEKMLEGAK